VASSSVLSEAVPERALPVSPICAQRAAAAREHRLGGDRGRAGEAEHPRVGAPPHKLDEVLEAALESMPQPTQAYLDQDAGKEAQPTSN
jgi:hypothetical protein